MAVNQPTGKNAADRRKDNPALPWKRLSDNGNGPGGQACRQIGPAADGRCDKGDEGQRDGEAERPGLRNCCPKTTPITVVTCQQIHKVIPVPRRW